MAYSADGKSVVTSHSGHGVAIINPATSQPRAQLQAPFPIGHPHFALQDKRLIGALARQQVGIWETAKGRLLGKVNLPPGTLADLTVAPDGQKAAVAVAQADGKGVVAFLDVNTRKRLPIEFPCSNLPRCLRYTPDGRWLVVTYQDAEPVLVDLTTSGLEATPFEAVGNGQVPFAFSPSGQFLAVGFRTHGRVYLWDMSTRKAKSTILLSSQHDIARDLAWSPDSRLLAIATSEGHIELWDVDTRRLLYTLRPSILGTKILYVRFSGDGQTLAASLETPNERGNSVVVFFPLGNSAAAAMQ